MKTKTTKLYTCKFKNYDKNWTERYLADLCFKIDMDNLTRQKDDKINMSVPKRKK